MLRIISAIGLLALGAIVGVVFHPIPSTTAAKPTNDPSAPVANLGEARAPSEDTEAIRRLQHQLVEKNKMIGSLLAMKAGQPATTDSHAGLAPPKTTKDAMQVLDERVKGGAAGSSVAAELRRALTTAIAGGALGSSHLGETECAGNLCRIDLVDATAEENERNSQRLVQAMGKSIGGFVAIDLPGGEKVLYFAKDSADLRVTPPMESEPAREI